MNILNLLWSAAGADSQILNFCPKSDQIKIASIGLVVITLTFVAWISLTIALIFIFNPSFEGSLLERIIDYSVYLLIGVVWAFTIFNIYRLIISSNGYGDGTSELTLEEVKDNLFKILMALFLGICISCPITVVLLHDEIINEQSSDEAAELEHEQKVVTEKYSSELGGLYKELAKYETGLLRLTGKNSVSAQSLMLNSNVTATKKEIQDLRENIERDKNQIKKNVTLIDETEKAFILHKPIALSSLIFIALICVLPVFLRIIWVKGPYEYLSQYQNNLVLMKYGVHSHMEFFNNGERLIREDYSVPNKILSDVINKLEMEKYKRSQELRSLYKRKVKSLKQNLSM